MPTSAAKIAQNTLASTQPLVSSLLLGSKKSAEIAMERRERDEKKDSGQNLVA